MPFNQWNESGMLEICLGKHGSEKASSWLLNSQDSYILFHVQAKVLRGEETHITQSSSD